MTFIYRKIHLTTAKCSLFSSARRMFNNIDYTLGTKIKLNKFRRIKMMQSMFFNNNGIKLEINYRKTS